MIILCMSGIPKSTAVSVEKGIIDYDMEVSRRMVRIAKDPLWTLMYVDSLLSMDRQGFTVLGDINKHVIKGMDSEGIDYKIIIPDISLKKAWFEMMAAEVKKNPRAAALESMIRLNKEYDDIFKSLKDRDNTIIVKDMDFSLENIIEDIKKGSSVSK